MTGQNKPPQRYILKINGSGYAAYKFRRELEKQLALMPKVNDNAYVITVTLTESYISTTYGTGQQRTCSEWVWTFLALP